MMSETKLLTILVNVEAILVMVSVKQTATTRSCEAGKRQ